jgi:hypothetical protein
LSSAIRLFILDFHSSHIAQAAARATKATPRASSA